MCQVGGMSSTAPDVNGVCLNFSCLTIRKINDLYCKCKAPPDKFTVAHLHSLLFLNIMFHFLKTFSKAWSLSVNI